MFANPASGAPSSFADVSAAPSAWPTDIRHLVVIDHPDPASFAHAVAQTCRSAVEAYSQSVVMRDLFDIGFDPHLKAHERQVSLPTHRAVARGADHG